MGPSRRRDGGAGDKRSVPFRWRRGDNLGQAGKRRGPGTGRAVAGDNAGSSRRGQRDRGTRLHRGVRRGSGSAVEPEQPPASHGAGSREGQQSPATSAGFGGFSTAPAAHLHAHLPVHICSPTVPPSAPAAPNSAKNQRNRQLGSGQGQAGKGPAGILPERRLQRQSAHPRARVLKFRRCLGRSAGWGAGRGQGTHKGTRHKKPLSVPVLSWAFSLPGGRI